MERKNRNNVRIKMCCASCSHLTYGDKAERRCALKDVIVGNETDCEDWSMSDKMNNLKIKSKGKIKKPAYLMWFANEAKSAYRKAQSEGKRTWEWSINALRKTWEEENGQSIYL